MVDKEKILFIINPISGVGRQKIIETELEKSLDLNKFEYDIAYTEHAGHATTIALEQKDNYPIIACVGGDGSVNEVAQSLVYSNTKLAIIPTGSGNGLARHLKIPIHPKKAIQLLNNYKSLKIDTAEMNGTFFIGTAGLGFDAFISDRFSRFGKRGFLSYVKLCFKLYTKYQPKTYTLTISNKSSEKELLTISFCNSCQWGNNAIIAPGADLQDEVLDIVMVKKIPLFLIPLFAIKLFSGKLSSSKYYSSFKCKEIQVSSDNEYMHVDGEPNVAPTITKVKVIPKTILVLTN